jgi:hypothetical protein
MKREREKKRKERENKQYAVLLNCETSRCKVSS